MKTHDPVPFTIYYPGIQPDEVLQYDELSVTKGAYGTIERNQFINTFLGTIE